MSADDAPLGVRTIDGERVAYCHDGHPLWTSQGAVSPPLVALRDHLELHHRPEGNAQ